MFLPNNSSKKSKSSGFADNVRALTDLVSVGVKLATTSGTLLFIWVVRDGLAEAFTRDFVRLAFFTGILLVVGAAYTAYKTVERMAEAAEEAAIAIAEKAKAERETEALKQKVATEKNDARVLEMQAQFNALIAASLSGRGGLPAPKAGAPQALRKGAIKLNITKTDKRGSKSAFVIN